jgi:hypothetical protein
MLFILSNSFHFIASPRMGEPIESLRFLPITARAFLTFSYGLSQQGEHKINLKFGASPCG